MYTREVCIFCFTLIVCVFVAGFTIKLPYWLIDDINQYDIYKGGMYLSLIVWLPLNGSLTNNQGLDQNNISGTPSWADGKFGKFRKLKNRLDGFHV